MKVSAKGIVGRDDSNMVPKHFKLLNSSPWFYQDCPMIEVPYHYEDSVFLDG